MRKNIIESVLISCAVLITSVIDVSAQKAKKASNLPLSSEYKTITVTQNIPYRDGASQAWKLDMAMPANFGGKLRPAMVIVHGGGWRAGSKEDCVYQNFMVDYAQKGFVAININYRLTDEAPFPACIEDVKCAVRWLRAHAKEYNIDPQRIGAFGHSAGAHLALMLAMTPKSAGLEGDGGWQDYSSLVNVVVAGSPPTELGRDVPMAKPVWWPIGYITTGHPPMLLIQGSDDRIVRPNLTEDFVEKMKKTGSTVEYIRIDSVGHEVGYSSKLNITAPATEKFFEKYLKPDSDK
ncbi:alpha/beta hydrolase [Dyadobacter sp. CY345]|uniref:alpha/beta hydrolase n=1 Tax=Dyadobacter sp. CY345 TaxID=2909335 RepID=UPI001F3DEE4B|nr:alpha/beta hydrolase [Dyadobacter sp. CY345]MCF2446909.1 alpha/beta hydrolase [Dyadobacter sp. CY345]